MMKNYFAGPLFSAGEKAFNTSVAAALRDAGHEVFLPQESEENQSANAAAIFHSDVARIDWADIVLANMDGPDPDSGTCWECGYAYGKKPFIVYRTDSRVMDGKGQHFNLILTQSADLVLDLRHYPMPTIIVRLVDAVSALTP
jgi:nucleoside 2-deoxyribosyltransferase